MMKRFTLIWIAFFAIIAVRAQLPDNWTGDTDIETFQEAVNIHGGSYSCGVIVNTDVQANCDFDNGVEIPVTAGEPFRFSFWGNTSENARGRAAFTWVGANKTYSSNYLGPNTGGWMLFEYEDVVPDGATGVYLGIRFYDVQPNFTPGETQYIDDVSFESPTGTALVVANGDLESWPGINAEPTDYPQDFGATAAGINAILSWIDPAGGQLPENYLIKASLEDNIINPEDGIYIPDDFNFTDGKGAVNVAYGDETFTFTNLQAQQTYYFKIFPYTNSGTNIDFKNDGTPPAAQVEISSVVIIESENFDASWGNWTPVSVLGDEVWDRENTYGVGGTPCAQMTGFVSGTTLANEDWLISPSMDFTQYQNELLSFYTAVGYIASEDQFAAKISLDYDGGGTPNTATWTDLNPVLPDGATNWVWTNSGNLDISGFNGNNVHIALIYSCGTIDAATWEVDEILITGEGQVVVDPEPTNYPTDFAASASGTSISLSWTDATGETLPTGYLVLASDQDNIALPADGIPAANDTDLSDGSAALNIVPGAQAASFAGLTADITYYFKIFPFTNTGSAIDYKNDGTPPSAQATTEQSNEVDILFTTFDNGWENWTAVSVVGDQVWDRENTYGLEGTPCASMSGYEGAPFDNEDWLISPAIDLTEYSNETFEFYSAFNYTGPDLEVLISTDYDGSGNPNDFTWEDFSDQVQWPAAGSYFEWTASGMIDIADYTDQTIYVAFKFTSTVDGSATWELDNIAISGEGEVVVIPEPTNYPTAYTVTAMGQTITTSWTDATGEVIPEGYVVLIYDQTDFDLPEDGTPIANDNDYSDGNGAINVMPGTQAATFSGLMAGTMYYTVLIPYTNSGTLIDYKTEIGFPNGSATTGEAAPDILFTTFNESWESWTAVSVVGDQIWDRDNSYGFDSTACARMSGYSGGALDNEDWLISPAIKLTGISNQTLDFFSASAYTGPALELFVSTDYDGSGDPNDFTWDNLTDQASWPVEGSFFDFTSSGQINIASYSEQTIFIAFKFNSTIDGSATWEVDNIRVAGEVVVIPEPTNYPTDFIVSGLQEAIQLSWTDATGEVVPQGYLILITTQEEEIEIPLDGTPVADDTDLSDNMGAINVMAGVGTYTFIGLSATTTYYAVILPYTNSGTLIDYKTDFPPPNGSATTEEAGIGEYQNSLSISLYPNPGNGMLYFDAEKSLSSIQVFNLIGMKVYEINASGSKGQIDLTALEKGIYMIHLEADNKVITKRIVIQ